MDIFLLFFTLFLKTPEQVYDFLILDQTNTISYSAEFDCVQYSETLIENAVGFDAVPVMVGWKTDESFAYHEFVAFNTTEGIIWIEPQNDRQYVVSESELCYIDGECIADLSFVYYDGEFMHTVSQQ